MDLPSGQREFANLKEKNRGTIDVPLFFVFSGFVRRDSVIAAAARGGGASYLSCEDPCSEFSCEAGWISA